MKGLVILIVTFLSLNAFALGDSGCGLGSLIIDKNGKLTQLLSMTTNGTSWTQAFGITSGTSNCSSSGLVSNEREKQYFAEANYNELSKNIARGGGETLDAFAVLHGCITPRAKTEFAVTLKENMIEVMPHENTSSMELVSNVSQQISKNRNLKELCSAKL